MKFLKVVFISLFLTSCIGNLTSTVFGIGVNINLDPRSPGLYRWQVSRDTDYEKNNSK